MGVVVEADVNVTRTGTRRPCAGVRNGENANGFSEAVYIDAFERVVAVVSRVRTIALGKVDQNAFSNQISYNAEVDLRYAI